MAAKKVKCIGVLTSGGDAPGMNAAVRAVVRRTRFKGLEAKGIRRGYQGLIENDIIDLQSKDVSDTIERGGTMLFSARCKEMHTEEGIKLAAKNCKAAGIDALVAIGGDGTFRGALALAHHGINVIGVPATIDLDIASSDYSIGFDTAVNTAMEAIDKVRDTSISHERVSIIEVMGRKAGYIALWTGIASGAEEIILPEEGGIDELKLIGHIMEARKKGKSHYVVINAEGIGHSTSLAKRVEEATGITTRATILGYMQRGGSPSCRDRLMATTMGAYAADLLIEGKKNRVVVYRDGKITDLDIDEALAMEKELSAYECEIARCVSYSYEKW